MGTLPEVEPVSQSSIDLLYSAISRIKMPSRGVTLVDGRLTVTLTPFEIRIRGPNMRNICENEVVLGIPAPDEAGKVLFAECKAWRHVRGSLPLKMNGVPVEIKDSAGVQALCTRGAVDMREMDSYLIGATRILYERFPLESGRKLKSPRIEAVRTVISLVLDRVTSAGSAVGRFLDL